MTRFRLGINSSFAINRFPEPEVWLQIVGQELGLRYAQIVADLVNPFLPAPVVEDLVGRIKASAATYDVSIESAFTSNFTRVNHLLHPDRLMREAWFEWYKQFLELAARLGARSAGSHFGILSVRDAANPIRRDELFEEACNRWRQLAEFGREKGLEYLLFEPMSIAREMAETISKARHVYEKVNEGSEVPIYMLLDVDHGDVSSEDPRDLDPYAWLEEFGRVSPVVHIKQSTQNKSAHWPFTSRCNELGIIRPEKVLAALENSGAEDVLLVLEISHREREPAESSVLSDLKESVEYWRPYVKD